VKNSRPILHAKIGCRWCAEVREVLNRQGIGYEQRSVTTNAVASAEMMRLSGQTKAPVLNWSGEILADFGAAELGPFPTAKGLPWKVPS
jgi:glutaredoxin